MCVCVPPRLDKSSELELLVGFLTESPLLNGDSDELEQRKFIETLCWLKEAEKSFACCAIQWMLPTSRYGRGETVRTVRGRWHGRVFPSGGSEPGDA